MRFLKNLKIISYLLVGVLTVNLLSVSSPAFSSNAAGLGSSVVWALHDIAVRWFNSSIQAGDPTDKNNPVVYNTNPSTNPSQIINDHSIFNPINNTYETYNNYYTDNNTYHVSSDQYDYSVTNNTTYVSYVITDNLNPSQNYYYNIYYQLPDGRSSYNLTPNDIRGVIFNYNVVNYEVTPLGDDCLGIWHLDGNFHNELMQDENLQGFNAHYSQSWVDGFFNGGAQLTEYLPQDYFALQTTASLPSVWTIDFKVYFPKSGQAAYVNGGDLNLYGFNPFAFLETTSAFGGYFKISPDTWHEISITKHANGYFTMYLDGYRCGLFSDGANKIFGSGNDNFICYGLNEGDIVFQTHASGVTIQDPMRSEVRNLGFIIDEVRVMRGATHEENENFYYPSSMPYDVNFAYTVPNVDLVVNYEKVPFGNHFTTVDLSNFVIDNDTLTFYISDFTNLELSGTNFLINLPFIFRDRVNSFSRRDVLINQTEFIKYDLYHSIVRCVIKYDNFLGAYYCFVYKDDTLLTTKYISNDNFEFNDFIRWYSPYNCSLYKPVYGVSETIAIQSNFDVNEWQIGGVRNPSPVTGDVFMSFDDGYVLSCQQYFYGRWNEVPASIFYEDRWYDVKTFNFDKLMVLPDDNINRPTMGGNTIINNYYNSSGGGGIDEESKGMLSSIATNITNWYTDWKQDDSYAVYNPFEPELDTNIFNNPEEYSWKQLLLPLIVIVFILLFLIEILNIILLFMDYILSLIMIPAFSDNLPESFTQAFDWLRGDVPDPFYIISIGNLNISCFDFMVLIFEIAFLGTFILIIRKYFNNISIPALKEKIK